jgi:hypothetical protein
MLTLIVYIAVPDVFEAKILPVFVSPLDVPDQPSMT